jgi:lipopolysaccharide/colanic/teichoic acid biosynthesis glycosyltransferase
MWKVRTMRADGTGGVALGPSLTLGELDPRVTAVGRRIRRWRIDELANLVNILKGEMALIGGRPEAPEYVDRGDLRWATVLAAPPGLVGPSQILVHAWETELLARDGPDAYRAQVLPVKLAIDEWYVTRATWRVDLAVLGGLVRWLTRRASSDLRLRELLARDLGNALDGLPAA